MLEEFSGQQPLNLDELFGKQESKAFVPEATARNKAALTAFLSDEPMQLEDNYRLMFAELKEGNTATVDSIKNKTGKASQDMDIKAAMSILGDMKLPVEQKQAAIEFLKNRPAYLSDTTTEVAIKAASAESKGENKEQEKMRVTSAAEALAPVYEYRNQLQGIRNAHAASQDSGSRAALSGLLETILPFATNVNGVKTLKKLQEELGIASTSRAALLPGSATMAIRDALANVPPAERADVAKNLMSVIGNNGIISNDNGFSQWMTANSVFEEGGYSNTDKWLDNAAGLLDTIGLGFMIKAPVNAAKVATITRNAERASALPAPHPVSPANVISQANPDKGRKLFQVIVSGDDEASKALTGVSRDDAVTSMLSPQVASVDGSVAARVPEVDRKTIEVSGKLDEAVEGRGGIEFTEAEKAVATSNIISKFRDAKDMVINDAMTTIGRDGKSVKINAVYGTSEGGFSNPLDAIEQAKLSLREYGIQDQDITLLKRNGDVYEEVPKTFKDAGIEGDYLVQVKTSHDITPIDVGSMEQLDVKRNWFDRIPSLISKNAGSLSRHLFDAISMLHPRLVNPAVVATDRATLIDKILLEMHTKFADKFMKFDSLRRAKVYEHLKEANFKGFEWDDTKLIANGFTGEEISAIKDWRNAWDAHFYLENRDLVKTLQIRGFQVFEDAQDKFFAKPITKNSQIGHVYDTTTKTVVPVTKQLADDLYDVKGGTFAQLRRPIDVGGQAVEHIMVHNTHGNYLRGINNTDQVLNYRKGYYQVQYRSPVFVVEKVKDASGNVKFERAIAVAGNTPDAEHFLRRKARMNGVTPEEYGYTRYDKNSMPLDSDAYWDLQHVQGRIAQRHRGKTLETTDSTVHVGDTSFIADPIESAIRSARSLSGRVAIREVLEASKQRAIQQYGDLFPKREGQVQWPTKADEIGLQGRMGESRTADARTTWEYLNYLENGYINSIDDVVKGMLNALGTTLGKAGLGKAERAATWLSDIAPMSNARAITFHALIGMNPLRQLVVQPHQILRMLAYDAKAFLGSVEDMNGFLAYKATGKYLNNNTKDFVKFVEESGMLDAVDRHNLVRGTISDLANSSNIVRRAGGKLKAAVVDTPRKVGFDIGEQINLLAHLATIRKSKMNKGLNVADKAVRDEIYAEARNLSYGMNYATDMPYNQTFASALLQFMQVPHKAILQITTNRGLSRIDKAKMGIFDALMWGIPAVTIAEAIGYDILPDDEFARETLLFGLESAALNNFFSTITGEDVKMDYSSLAPYDMTGWAKIISTYWSEGLGQTLLNTPTGQLYFGNNPRITNAFKKLGQFFGWVEDPDLSPEDEVEVIKEFAKITSGMSNAFKAKAILDSHKRLDSKGGVIDPTVNNMEALGQLFGFPTQDATQYFAMSKKMREGTKEHKDEVVKYVDMAFKTYSERFNAEAADAQVILRVVGTGFRIFKDDIVAQGIIRDEISKRLLGPDQKLIKQALDYAKIADPETTKSRIKQLPIDEEKKKQLLEIANHFQNAKRDLEEMNK